MFAIIASFLACALAKEDLMGKSHEQRLITKNTYKFGLVLKCFSYS